MKHNEVFEWPEYFTNKALNPGKFLGGMSYESLMYIRDSFPLCASAVSHSNLLNCGQVVILTVGQLFSSKHKKKMKSLI